MKSKYYSVDPAPPAEKSDLKELEHMLLDTASPLFDRYRAMFALRNLDSPEAIEVSLRFLHTILSLMLSTF